jgi:hypothetical protein
MVLATPPQGYAGSCAAIADLDLRDDLSRITAPTLVLAGDRDPSTPPEHLRLIADLVPDSRYVEFPGAHFVQLENLDSVAALISDLVATDRSRQRERGGARGRPQWSAALPAARARRGAGTADGRVEVLSG